MQKKYIISLVIVFIAITIISRLTPHPWNFTPVGALFLFSGFTLPKKWMWLPLAALVATDLIIGTYQWQVMMTVYGSYALMMSAAHAIRPYKAATVLASSIAGAVLFFLATNTAHWMWFGGYEYSFMGLMAAYAAGIPFFRNSLLGYIAYSGVFFAAYEALAFMLKVRYHAKDSIAYEHYIGHK